VLIGTQLGSRRETERSATDRTTSSTDSSRAIAPESGRREEAAAAERQGDERGSMAPKPPEVPDKPPPLSRHGWDLLATVEDPAVRADAEALRDALKALMPHRRALLADDAALARLLVVLADPGTPLNGVGREWFDLLDGDENARIAAAAADRIEANQLHPTARASDEKALVKLYVRRLGSKRDEGVLQILESLRDVPSSALTTMILVNLDGGGGPMLVERLRELAANRDQGASAFQALCRLDTPEAQEAAWSLILRDPMVFRHQLADFGPHLTPQRADTLRASLGGPEGEALFLQVLAAAPLETMETQQREMRAMIGRALADESDQSRYLAAAAAAARYAELAADEELLDAIKAGLERAGDFRTRKALKIAADRLETKLYGG